MVDETIVKMSKRISVMATSPDIVVHILLLDGSPLLSNGTGALSETSKVKLLPVSPEVALASYVALVVLYAVSFATTVLQA